MPWKPKHSSQGQEIESWLKSQRRPTDVAKPPSRTGGGADPMKFAGRRARAAVSADPARKFMRPDELMGQEIKQQATRNLAAGELRRQPRSIARVASKYARDATYIDRPYDRPGLIMKGIEAAKNTIEKESLKRLGEGVAKAIRGAAGGVAENLGAMNMVNSKRIMNNFMSPMGGKRGQRNRWES